MKIRVLKIELLERLVARAPYCKNGETALPGSFVARLKNFFVHAVSLCLSDVYISNCR